MSDSATAYIQAIAPIPSNAKHRRAIALGSFSWAFAFETCRATPTTPFQVGKPLP
ncbi:MAG: hypothetical protein SAL70_10295 [Scytonema sp. PMC 1070.18]|nr:hypothetical protein [Scytonema sp. PMC 1070.18]